MLPASARPALGEPERNARESPGLLTKRRRPRPMLTLPRPARAVQGRGAELRARFLVVVLPLNHSAGRKKALPRPLNEEKVGGWEIWAASNRAIAAEGLWCSFMNSNLV